MATEEEDDGGGIPEWVVTFGDMMSLLLTFFIMLVSLSEIKEEEKFQALVESIKQKLGHTTSLSSMVPGPVRPRNSPIQQIANMARAKRKDMMRGGAKVQAPVGENKQVRIIRPGTRTVDGTTLLFKQGSLALAEGEMEAFQQQVQLFRGKPQKIEIRGHTSRRPIDDNSEFSDHWELAFERCRLVMSKLVEEYGIDPRRIRISVAGSTEPLHIGTDPEKLKKNPRVEVFTLDEVVSEFLGTGDERTKRFTN